MKTFLFLVPSRKFKNADLLDQIVLIGIYYTQKRKKEENSKLKSSFKMMSKFLDDFVHMKSIERPQIRWLKNVLIKRIDVHCTKKKKILYK